MAASMEPRVTLEELSRELLSQSIYKMQQGRYFVALSLEEAEHLRGTLQGSQVCRQSVDRATSIQGTACAAVGCRQTVASR